MEDGDLFCLDWKALNFNLYGDWQEAGDYNAVNIRLIPCATQFESYDGTILGGNDECVWDEKEVKDYIGESFRILVYHNQ